MMINSGLNFVSCGRIRFSKAERNLALPSSGASGALTMVFVARRARHAPRCREQRHLVRRAIHHRWVGPEDVLGAVAVMDVEIDHRRRARCRICAARGARRSRGIVEEAEAQSASTFLHEWPGGRTATKAFGWLPDMTASVAETAPPTPRITASQVPGDIEVSPSDIDHADVGAMWRSSVT